MGQYNQPTPEERARIAEIQDLLIDRYVVQKEVLDKGLKDHTIGDSVGNTRAPPRNGENQGVREGLIGLSQSISI
jgi:hypothetical protein